MELSKDSIVLLGFVWEGTCNMELSYITRKQNLGIRHSKKKTLFLREYEFQSINTKTRNN